MAVEPFKPGEDGQWDVLQDEQVQGWATTGYLVCASVVSQEGMGGRQRTAARIFLGGKGRIDQSKTSTTFEKMYREDEVRQSSRRRFASVRSHVSRSRRAGTSGSTEAETGRRAATERTRRHRGVKRVRSFRHLEPRRRPRSWHPRRSRSEMVDTHAVGRGCEGRHRTLRRRRRRRGTAEEEERRWRWWCSVSLRYSSRCRHRSRRRQPGASRASLGRRRLHSKPERRNWPKSSSSGSDSSSERCHVARRGRERMYRRITHVGLVARVCGSERSGTALPDRRRGTHCCATHALRSRRGRIARRS